MAHKPKTEQVSKTNAMRALDRAGIAYDLKVYEVEDETSVNLGLRVAEATGIDPDAAFKTLVCCSPTGSYAVFCIPVGAELDLKKAAQAARQKSLSLLPIHDLPKVTGYIRGGCSPVGMKKPFPTFFDETALLFDKIAVSGGRIGTQILLDPETLVSFCDGTFIDLVED